MGSVPVGYLFYPHQLLNIRTFQIIHFISVNACCAPAHPGPPAATSVHELA